MKKFIPSFATLVLLGTAFICYAQKVDFVVKDDPQKKQVVISPNIIKARKANGAKANTQWTGAVSSDWNNTGNWDTGNVPTSDDNVSKNYLADLLLRSWYLHRYNHHQNG